MILPAEHAAGPPSGLAKFPMGRLMITPAALAALTPHDVHLALTRHVQGNWGDVCAEDAAQVST